jgi:uncharacterized membrane protein YvlD (DUF360 family)
MRFMLVLESWLFLSAGIWLVAQVLPGFRVQGLKGALWVGAMFGLLHFFIGWLLFTVIGFGTLFLGFIFSFVTWWLVSAILLKVTDALTDDLTIDSFKTALIGAGFLSVLSALRTLLLGA